MMNKVSLHELFKLEGVKLAAVLILSSFFSTICLANPVPGGVVSGSISIKQGQGTTNVHQKSAKGIIFWKQFNIDAGEHTHFQQPKGGITLNRVSPVHGPSQIFGALTATGKIILINQSGVYFGPSARVDVGGLIASTANISNKNFLSGRYIFNQPSPYRGSIVNEGSIKTANYGLVALMGTSVVNKGVIEANLGNVVLASGNTFTVNLNGDNLIHFSIGSEAKKRGLDQNGQELKDGVSNEGRLVADGGKVLMVGRVAQGVVDNVVNISGVAQAKSVRQQNGVIILDGGKGPVRVAGKIDAPGGKVKVLAQKVKVESPAVIDVSSDVGGEILIGGNQGGLGPEYNAEQTLVESGAVLKANGGGRIIVWSDGDTAFHGSALADGGFVETSGKNLNVDGAKISAREWLLDPDDFTIDAGNVASFTDVLNGLNGATQGNVTVVTTSSGSGGNGDIFVDTLVSWNTGQKLTLSAFRDITINSNIVGSGNLATLILRADNEATGVGTINNNADIQMSGVGGSTKIYYNPTDYTTPTDFSGGISAGTHTAYMLVNSAANLQNMSANLAGNYGLGKNINAGTFTPIGSTGTPYTGKFDGQGYLVFGLSITGLNDRGLFGGTSNTALIENVGVSGKVTGTGTNAGGLVGNNLGTIRNSYSFAAVSGVNNVGGLVGNNGATGDIDTSYSIGYVTGVTNVGGFAGLNTGTLPATNYWDTQSSGRLTSAGSATGLDSSSFKSGLPAGLSSAIWGTIPDVSYPYLLAAHASQPRVISGQLVTFNSVSVTDASVTPNSFANSLVMIPEWPPVNDTSLAGETVHLVGDGIKVESTHIGADGSYYFLVTGEQFSDSAPVLTYLTSTGGDKATSVTVAPTAGGSITNMYLAKDTLLLVDNEDSQNETVGYNVDITTPNPTEGYKVNFNPQPVTYISNDHLVDVLGGLSDNDILYTVSGSNIEVRDGHNFVSAPQTLYGLTSDLSTSNGDITLYGPTLVSNAAPENVFMTTNGTGNIVNNNTITWMEGPDDDNPNAVILNLDSAENIVLNAPVLGMWWIGTAGSGGFNQKLLGSLVLSAAFTDKSITTGPSGTITVFDFYLDKGKWWQVVPRYTTYGAFANVDTLPYYQVSFAGGPPLDFSIPLYAFLSRNEFQIARGLMPALESEFIRATYESTIVNIGTPSNPFLIEGIYGLQGIGSSAYTLSSAFKQIQNIGDFNDGSTVFFWNGGSGFVPIGDGPDGTRGEQQIGFTGSFDGDFYDMLVLNIFWPGTDHVGLFGYVGAGGVVKNSSPSTVVIGGNNVGGAVGSNFGTVSYINTLMPFVAGSDNVGGVVGYNAGDIYNSMTTAASLDGAMNVGGIAGFNEGTIYKVLSVAYLLGSAQVGAIAGLNSGSILHSFWDKEFSGLPRAVGVDLGTQSNVKAGCFGPCLKAGNKNLVDLTLQSTYTQSGWSFSSTEWNILPRTTSFVQTANGLKAVSKNYSYPYLKLQTGGLYKEEVNGVLTVVMDFTLPHFLPGGDPQIFAGFLTGLGLSEVANQPLAPAYTILGLTPSFDPAGVFTVTSGFAQSGANGFFYGLANAHLIPDNQIVTAVTFGSVSGTLTYKQPVNNGSLINLLISVGPGSPTPSPVVDFLTFLNGFLVTGSILNSIGNSASIANSVNTQLAVFANYYTYNLQRDPGALYQSNLLASCSDLTSQACQELMTKFGSNMSPEENITYLLSIENKKDAKIRSNNEYIPAHCSI